MRRRIDPREGREPRGVVVTEERDVHRAEREGRLGLNFWQGASHRHNLRSDGHVYVSPVRAFPPNAWGLYDLSGNIWEWVWDWYGAYPAAAGTDPIGPRTGQYRVLRGGAWLIVAVFARVAYRGSDVPGNRNRYVGFRVARSLP